MDARTEVERLLLENGARIARHKKHVIWKFPDGGVWTTPKSPSDFRAWGNNLSKLRAVLGLRSPSKQQSDFDHQKKESEQPQQPQQLTDYLALLPQREAIPQPPPGPTLLEQVQHRYFEENPDKAPPEVYPIAGRIPLVIRRRAGHRGSERSGDVYGFSKEVLAHANFLLSSKGKQAADQYLCDIRAGKTPELKLEEKTTMNDFTPVNPTQSSPTPPSSPTQIVEGGIETQLKLAREKVRHFRRLVEVDYQKMIVDAKQEIARWEHVVQSLESALNISTASKHELGEVLGLPAQAPVALSANGKVPRGFWKERIEEAIATSDMAYTRDKLVTELMQFRPEAPRGAVYAAVYTYIANGYLYEDEDRFVRLTSQKKEPSWHRTER